MTNKFYFTSIVFFLIVISFACQKPSNEAPWEALFNGDNLDGWNQKGGEAMYAVRDGMIVGTTVHNTPNSFLTTNKMYGDFILELDYKVDSTMNSGIQIRSNSFPYYHNGQVHGYQIEIDPSKRAWSAGIYEEGRRGWLYPLTNNTAAQNAFKQNQWNHYRIEAIGDTLKTWINNVPAAYLIDDKTASGFIALQVHGIGAKQKAGTEIHWKNIQIITKNVRDYSRSTPLTAITTKNTLLPTEEQGGWTMLWNGVDTDQWRGAKLAEFPSSGWRIENGELTVLGGDGKESTGGGDIVTKASYGDFELKLDFKLSEGANSGVKYYVDTDLNKGEGSAIGLEYQLLDDAVHPDAKLGSHEGSRTLASLYDLIQADPNKHANPVGSWNSLRIYAKNQKVSHWLNGVKVVEYDRSSPEFKALVSTSKYKQWPGFGQLEKGHILLQDHGNTVSFKNIKIRAN